MKSETLKGYVLTVVFGVVLLAVALLVALQWGVKSTFSFYGRPVENIPTIWLVLIAGAACPLVLVICRLFFSGVRILYKSRRQEARKGSRD